jgi:hypothetical protein
LRMLSFYEVPTTEEQSKALKMQDIVKYHDL